MPRLPRIAAVALVIAAASASAQDGAVAYPDGYRNWFHVTSRVNLTGSEPESAVGFHHIYANEKARAGLDSGQFEDGAVFVLDRFKYNEGEDKTLNEGDRRVLAVMLKDAAKFKGTGGWGFEGFKGGDASQRVVKDGQACFVCHIPFEKQGFVISRPHK